MATTVATTVAPTTTLSPQQALFESVGGTWDVTRVVTQTNPKAVPIGTTDHFTIGFDPSCAGGACEVGGSGKRPLTAGTGNDVSFSGTATEGCVTDPSRTVTDSWKMVLRVIERDATGRATRLRGEETLTVADLAGCPNVVVSPIVFSLDGVRSNASPGTTTAPSTSSP